MHNGFGSVGRCSKESVWALGRRGLRVCQLDATGCLESAPVAPVSRWARQVLRCPSFLMHMTCDDCDDIVIDSDRDIV